MTKTEKLEVYKPELIKETPSDLPKPIKAYNKKLFSELKKGNGLIKVKLDNDVVIQRISHDLYANWKSGIRELFNNEVRACNRAKKDYGLNPHIEITLDPQNKKLSIHGINSLGIDTQIFLNVVRVLGVSDNFDSSEVGQFGFGFASYTTVSDTIILETYSAKTKERFAVSGKSGVGFDILPEPKNLENYGTRISLIYKKETESVLAYVNEIASFKTVPVYLILPSDVWKWKSKYYRSDDKEKEIIVKKGKYLLNSNTSLKAILKKHLLEQLNKHHYYFGYNSSITVTEDNYSDVFLEIEKETEDYEFIGVICKRHNSSDPSPIGLLVRTPISFGYGLDKIKPFFCFIVNVKNERKYQPTTDRERLKDDCVETLKDDLLTVTANLHTLIDFETWEDLVKNCDKWDFYRTLLHCEIIYNNTPRHKREMLSYLGVHFRVYKSSEIKPVNESLAHIIRNRFSYEKIYFSTVNIETQIRAVLNRYTIVILTKNAGLMEKLGFKDLSKEMGLGRDFGKTKFSLHTSHIGSNGGWSSTESIKRTSKTMLLNELFHDSLYSRCVVFEKGINSYLSILSELLTDYNITQLKANQIKWLFRELENLKKNLEDKSEAYRIITFENWIKEIDNKEFCTNKGIIKAKNLKKYDYPIVLHNTDIKETASLLVNENYIYIPVSNNENFELNCYLTAKNIKFKDIYKEGLKQFEHLASNCYKCGLGTDSIRTEKEYRNLAFYLKKRLGKKWENLYDLFKSLTYVFHSGSYRNNSLEVNNETTKELMNIIIFYIENYKPQLRKKLDVKNLDVENYQKLTDFKGNG